MDICLTATVDPPIVGPVVASPPTQTATVDAPAVPEVHAAAPPTVGAVADAPLLPRVGVSDGGPPGPPGPPGPAGSGLVLDAIAGETIQALSVVVVDADGTAYLADPTDPSDGPAVVGVATTAALTGEPVSAALAGELASDAPLPVGPLYLGVGGGLTASPNAGVYQLRVGYAIAPDRLLVRFETPIFHA